FKLVIDKSLSALPTRPADGAIVLRTKDSPVGGAKARVFKLNATLNEPVLIEREQGHERQFRFHCPRCTLPVGYQSTPPPAKSGDFLYLFAGALTQLQGQLPGDALDTQIDV
ncbi:hypothetical protein CPB85DRAFT_1214707, partial [Mucidula mucida]